MALTSADLARLGPQAQKQVLDKLAGAQKPKKSKYGNRKVVCDGIKFDSEREAARFGELKVLRAMGKIRDLRLQVNFTLVEGYTTMVSHAVAKAQKNPTGKSWYVGVWTRWSNREYKEYFGEVRA